MSTKQLIVLWYGAIIMFVLLLVKVSSLAVLGVGAALLLLLLLYTMSRHHRASKHQVLLAIGLPMMLFGVTAFIMGDSVDDPSMYWQAPAPSFLSAAQVQIVDPKVQHSIFRDKISGKIQNNTGATLQSITLRVLFGGDAKTAETWHLKLDNLNIAPGASAPFQQQIGDIHLKYKKSWPWSFQVVAAEGQ